MRSTRLQVFKIRSNNASSVEFQEHLLQNDVMDRATALLEYIKLSVLLGYIDKLTSQLSNIFLVSLMNN